MLYADASEAHASRTPASRSLFGVLDRSDDGDGRAAAQALGAAAAAGPGADQRAARRCRRAAWRCVSARRPAQLLDGLYDVERLVGRIGFGNANARDLMALKRALLRLPAIKAK